MHTLVDSSRKFNPEISSSNPLIHLTDEWEKLKLIVKEGLRPNYCLETLSNENDTICAYFPMISATNVPIQEALSNLRSYGTFGIVLDKKWGELNNFSPVLYFEKKSELINKVIDEFKFINSTSINEIESAIYSITHSPKSRLASLLFQIIAHSKNFDGPLKRGSFFSPNHPYGLEREWRKVIMKEYIPYFIFKKEEVTQQINEFLSDNKIDFSIDNIKTIVIEEDWQEEEIKLIICEKYNLNSFTDLKIEFKKNTARNYADEG